MYDFFCLFLEIFESELGILSLFGWNPEWLSPVSYFDDNS